MGEVDLTAHVDFSSLIDIARAQGAQTWGPAPQGVFLSELGIQVRAQQLQAKASANQKRDIAEVLHRLTHPTQMGRLFKVMAVTAPEMPTPSGFLSCLPPKDLAA